MHKKAALRRLLHPRTLAVFGGGEAEEVLKQCARLGFSGETWVVNPGRDEMLGMRCFSSVADLPAAPDASFIATPPSASVEIVRDLAARGAGGAVCFASGFAEAGAEGKRLQDELVAAAGRMAVVGPNCHGFLNYLDGVALWPDQHGGRRVSEGVAIISQSGNVAINLTMQQRGLAISHAISIGNKAALDVHDYMELLLGDERVKAIGLCLESLEHVHEFSLAAVEALRRKIPVVAMKLGSSTLGSEMTLSHTSSLAGNDGLYSALFTRLGIARCDTLSQFLETLKFLSAAGTLTGTTVGSMSCSGGEASIVADCAERVGLTMPALSAEASTALREVLGPRVHTANPLDYHSYAWGDYDNLNRCFRAMLDNGFDCTILVLDYPPGGPTVVKNWEIAERALIDAAASTGRRAVVVASLPETLPEPARSRLLEGGIAPMQGLEDCLFAIRAAAGIGGAQERIDQIRPVRRPEPLRGPITALSEWESKTELADAGVSIPAGRLCDADGTVEAAETLGFPVAVKAVSAELAHKSEVGAVEVNLGDSRAVREATERVRSRGERMLVEKMAAPCVAEIIVGVTRDPTFGLTLLLGAGGRFVELLEDTVSLLLPVEREQIREAFESLKVARLVNGYRGCDAGDVDAILDAVEAIAKYAQMNNASLAELDVNPLIVTPHGAMAVDAFIRKC